MASPFIEKTGEELRELLLKKKSELQGLRFRVHEGQLKNVRSIRALRREIAQIETALTQALVS